MDEILEFGGSVVTSDSFLSFLSSKSDMKSESQMIYNMDSLQVVQNLNIDNNVISKYRSICRKLCNETVRILRTIIGTIMGALLGSLGGAWFGASFGWQMF